MLAASLTILAGLAWAADPQPMLLWPSGAPDSNGLHGPERDRACIGNVSIATLTLYRAPANKATGAAVVIIPGGGYGVVCVRSEGSDIAEWLNQRGITGVVLKYRLPNHHYEIPGEDARRAIRTVRANAAKWGIDPKHVGVWGFSAGGHLASTVATAYDAGNPKSRDPIARMSSRPDFAILFYPVISMQDDICHKGSRRNLMGTPTPKLIERFSNELHVTADTPPTFLLQCSDDPVVPVANSVRFYQALVAHHVPATCLHFEHGGHGPNAFRLNPSWQAALDAWFKKRGCLK